jgi:hypothetical protein
MNLKRSRMNDHEVHHCHPLRRDKAPETSARDVVNLCVQRQAAAIGVFLGFFGLCILAFEVGECYVLAKANIANLIRSR